MGPALLAVGTLMTVGSIYVSVAQANDRRQEPSLGVVADAAASDTTTARAGTPAVSDPYAPHHTARPTPPPAPARPTPTTPSPVADPVRIEIPSIGVDAAIDPLEVKEDTLAGPTRFSHAGWWQAGPEPGEPGAAVIAGHIDSYKGPAVFIRLHELQPGALVVVHRADRSSVSFRAVGIERHRKSQLPTDRVFAESNSPLLRLITCGGDFDEQRKSYRDNVVVYAVAAS